MTVITAAAVSSTTVHDLKQCNTNTLYDESQDRDTRAPTMVINFVLFYHYIQSGLKLCSVKLPDQNKSFSPEDYA